MQAELPAYAQPVFVRVQPDIEVTGTFKMIKGDLRKQAYDLSQIVDPVYVLKPRSTTYEQLDAEYVEQIKNQAAGF